jgi:hypothetical protein
MGDQESEAVASQIVGLFQTWTAHWDEEWDMFIERAADDFVEEIYELSESITQLDESQYSLDQQQEFVFPSLRLFLAACIIGRMQPVIRFTDQERLDAALDLWQNQFVAIFDGLAWRLHSVEDGTIVSTGLIHSQYDA